jgi:hypothetical protein
MLKFSIWRLESDQSALEVSDRRRFLAGCSKYLVPFTGQHALWPATPPGNLGFSRPSLLITRQWHLVIQLAARVGFDERDPTLSCSSHYEFEIIFISSFAKLKAGESMGRGALWTWPFLLAN